MIIWRCGINALSLPSVSGRRGARHEVKLSKNVKQNKKEMKKRILSVMALACCMISPVVLTSCGDDDNVPGKEEQKFGKYTSTEATYGFELTEVLDNLSYVTVKYTGRSGELESEEVLSGKWTKTVKSQKPLTECHMEVHVHKKDGADLSEKNPIFTKNESGKYVAQVGLKSVTVTGKTYDENGKQIDGGSVSLTSLPLTMEISHLQEYFERRKEAALYAGTVKFNADGTHSK